MYEMSWLHSRLQSGALSALGHNLAKVDCLGRDRRGVHHIPGAVQFLFPIPEMTSMDEKTKTDFLKLLGPNKERSLVFYCGFTKCGRSHNGAMWAVKLGYTNAYRCPGGIKAWMEADYPVGKIK